MTWRMIRSILALPTPVMVIVPALLVWASVGTAFAVRPAEVAAFWFWGAVALGLPAMALMVATVRLLVVQGKGIPAPWDPPKNFVVAGP